MHDQEQFKNKVRPQKPMSGAGDLTAWTAVRRKWTAASQVHYGN
jgi:hypothetical protein